jgi:adenosylcobinamide-GDP ribazoletransferase
MRAFFAAAQFLTRIPTPNLNLQARDLDRANYFYPVIGLGLGAFLAALNFALASRVPLTARLAVLFTLYVILTGGLHLDGLADTADGLFGGRTSERRLEIMRDSRIGTFGVLALFCVLGLQFTAALNLRDSDLRNVLLLAPGWSRASLVMASAISRPARQDGLGSSFISLVRPHHGVFVFLMMASVAAVLNPGMAIWSCIVCASCVYLLAIYFRSRIGGQTGDTLGATGQIVEAAIFWTFLIARGSR